MTKNYEQEREYMVWSQLEASGVRNRAILDAFTVVPRENFLFQSHYPAAYKDEDIDLGRGRILMEPAVHGRLIEALEVEASDVVLNVGSATGYSTAIFSRLVSTVVQIEDEQDLLSFSEEQYQALQLANIVSFKTDITKGCPAHAPYDIIFINGAVARPPEKLLEQLTEGGRLACICRESGQTQGKAMLYERVGDNYSRKILFDASVPYLRGFEPIEEFSL